MEMRCSGCGEIFIFRDFERDYYEQRGISEPRYCPICRKIHHRKMEQEKRIQEDLAWKRKKEEEFTQYIEELKDWNVATLAEVEPKSIDNTLYVIGNGFDLMHGARSSYYDFNKTLGKNSRLRFYLENYLKVDDLWADFEGALAKINVEAMCSSDIIDLFLDVMGAYDEDAGAAEFFCAAEMAANPITSINTELKKRFREWVCTLSTNTEDRPLKNVIKQGKVLNFNYTEFIEELYGVKETEICYIHGCRREKKGYPQEELILGHMPGDSDPEYNFEDQYSGSYLTDERAQMIYDAQQTSLEFVIEADEGLTKHCEDIIKSHNAFFEDLFDVNRIVTIGHSLYPVDWDYFEEMIRKNGAKEMIEWYFGCHGKKDLERIATFVNQFGLKKDHVFVFRTDLISVTVSQAEDISNNIRNRKLKEKVLALSDDGKWEIVKDGNKIAIYEKQRNRQVLLRIFSTQMSGAVFDKSSTCMFLVARGLYEGVFLFRYVAGEWKYIQELKGIPNQGVITKRLKRILLVDDHIAFIYNSRIRKYNINDGTLIFNQAIRRAPESEYEGEDLTAKFRKIYSTGFY